MGTTEIIGCQPGDFHGYSHLFSVFMDRDIAEKYFGNAVVASSELHFNDEVNVVSKELLFCWAKKHGLFTIEELVQAYPEYQKQFPLQCLRGKSRVRIFV